MQKYIFSIIMGMALCYGANAATMCAASDRVVVVLDPSISATKSQQDEYAKTWQATFSYGKIYGIASCNDKSGSRGMVNTDTVMSQSDTGQYCWCKMVSPAMSAWVFESNRNSTTGCAGSCASQCGLNWDSFVGLRQGLFRSAGI